jgi:hypothetical protein
LNQTAKGLPERVGEGEDQYELRPGVLKDLGRIKCLWHGNVFQALNKLQSLGVGEQRSNYGTLSITAPFCSPTPNSNKGTQTLKGFFTTFYP